MVLAVIMFTCSSWEPETCILNYRPSSTSLLFSPSSTKRTESIQKPAVRAHRTHNLRHGIAKIPRNRYSSHLLAADGRFCFGFFYPAAIECFQRSQPCHLSVTKAAWWAIMIRIIWSGAKSGSSTSKHRLTLFIIDSKMTEWLLTC